MKRVQLCCRIGFLASTLAVVWILLLGGCGRQSDIPVIASGSEYNDLLAKAQSLSQDILEKYEKGQSISDSEKERLRESLRIFKGLIAFNPEGYGPYFGAGKIHQILGEPQQALIDMKNFVEYAPENPDPELKMLIGEAYYTSGILYEANGEFDRAHACAHEAVKYFDVNPNYLAFLASAELRLKKDEAARKLVEKALAINPNHGRARQLEKLMGPAKG